MYCYMFILENISDFILPLIHAGGFDHTPAGFNQEIFTNSAKSANKPKASQTGATWPFKRNNRPDKKTQNTTPTVYSELHLFNMVWKILKVIIVITVRPQCRHEKTNTCIQYMLNQRIQYFEVRGLMTYFGKYL